MSMEKVTDMALVARATAFGDKRAFDTLVRRHQSAVRRFFLHQTLGDTQLSDDLAQDTFIKAWTSLSKFKGLSGFSTWLYRIACNVLYDHIRRQRPESDIDSIEVKRKVSHTTDNTLKMDIYQGLALLAKAERLCITLQLIDGLAIDKITEITDMPVGTIKSHLSRGKAKLAKYLKENGYE